ncbi:transposase family protein [Cryomorpha ignava]|uniref:Transposase family protein n=1 Tax=Cryomorpha ignava TaxID=101383 RepID=A0A7K3WVY5_9FLAO|nr:transposase family protein [Cryomorpha ignava]NEN25837.1 transposase family protein [Cryomorpha ignava]
MKDNTNPRMDRCKKHELTDLVAISICAVICGADCWDEIETYDNETKKWLSTFLKLTNGIPLHNAFNRLFSKLNPVEFETAFGN